MVSSDIKDRFIQRLLKYQDNRRCIDCGDENVEYVNVSFGCFICEKCFIIHLSLGLPENLKHFEDCFEIDDLLKLSSGGNTSLKEFFCHYELNLKAISYKYVTMCSEYYKSLILALSKGEDFETPLPSISSGLEASILLDSFVDSNIEFSNFEISKNPIKTRKKSSKNSNFFERLANSISKVWTKGSKTSP
jgi:hypothetical protein